MKNIEFYIKNTKNILLENIHNNIEHYYLTSNFKTKANFFKFVSKNTSIPDRRIQSWYYKEKLPAINSIDIINFTNFLNIEFHDFISNHKKYSDIKQNESYYLPCDIAKENLLKLFIVHHIYNGDQFEIFFQGIYSKIFFEIINRKNVHSRNLSWNFLIIASYYFEIKVEDFFKRSV